MPHDRLLDVAIREFGRHGLEGVGTRQIAKAADTAMSTITYHFGGKEQLYHAAAGRVAALMADELSPSLEAEAGVAPGDPAAARAALHRILAQFAERMASPSNADQSLFIAREQMAPTAAFDVLYAGVMGALVRRVRELVALSTGVDGAAATVPAMTLMGQAMVARTGRSTLLRLVDRPTVDADLIAALRAQVALNTDAILDRMIDQGPAR